VETYSHVAPEVEQRLLDGLEAPLVRRQRLSAPPRRADRVPIIASSDRTVAAPSGLTPTRPAGGRAASRASRIRSDQCHAPPYSGDGGGRSSTIPPAQRWGDDPPASSARATTALRPAFPGPRRVDLEWS
jgi:hypothetical protein